MKKHCDLVQNMTTEEKIALCCGRSFWSFGGSRKFGLPVIFTSDGPHGLRRQEKDEGYGSARQSIKSVCFPTASACACSFDPALMERMGEALASACHQQKVDLLLGPGINMKRDPLCGRNFEYYSEDPLLAGKMAAAFLRGLQSHGIGGSLKHFAGNSQETARMISDSRISAEALWNLYLPAFEIAVKEGKPWTIMAAYNRLNGSYCCENSWLLQDVLRTAWGYEGTVISDWGAINDPADSFQNGMDVEMPGGVTGDQTDVKEALRTGRLSHQRLDAITEHIADLSEKVLEGRRQTITMDTKAQLALAEEIEENSAVLLKNEGALPLDFSETVTVIGKMAACPRIQGGGSSKVQPIHVSEPLQALREAGFRIRYYPACLSDEEEYAMRHDSSPRRRRYLRFKRQERLKIALQAAESAAQVLFFGGLPDSMESEGYDRTHLSLPREQNRMIREICRRCPRTTVVLSCGSPVTMPWISEVNALLLMYLGGSRMGSACASLLSGKVNPSGKLAETFPLRLEDTPAYPDFPCPGKKIFYREGESIGYRHYNSSDMDVLFPFGHGLSYTTFSYEELQLDENQVRFTLRNIGDRFGKETVQLYLQAANADNLFLLKGFQKISLEAGQSCQVTFPLQPSDFARFSASVNGWEAKAGSYQIRIGSSSRDIRLTGIYCLNRDYVRELPIAASSEQDQGATSGFTFNSTLRDLHRKPVFSLAMIPVRKIAEKTSGGFIDQNHLWENILDSPFRSFSMGSNGRIRRKTVGLMVHALNRFVKKPSSPSEEGSD